MISAAFYPLESIESICQAEFLMHPLAELSDFCKLVFQACFGQGHFVGSQASVLAYLNQELSVMETEYLPLTQDVSAGMGLYRVSLSVLRQNLLSLEGFTNRFCNVTHPPVDWIAWERFWQKIEPRIVSLILDRNPSVNAIDSGSLASNNWLNAQREFCLHSIRQRQLMSHSETFRLTYNPHYRVMMLNSDDALLKLII